MYAIRSYYAQCAVQEADGLGLAEASVRPWQGGHDLDVQARVQDVDLFAALGRADQGADFAEEARRVLGRNEPRGVLAGHGELSGLDLKARADEGELSVLRRGEQLAKPRGEAVQPRLRFGGQGHGVVAAVPVQALAAL